MAGLFPWLITRWQHGGDFGASPLLAGAGGVLILLGAAGLIECFFRFAWTGLGTPAPVAPTKQLIVSGLYRHVRNPMYVAVLVLILGQALWLGEARLLVYGAAVWLAFHLFVIGYEEPALRCRFSEDYARFMNAVPRWLPRLKPWRGASGRQDEPFGF